MLAHASTLAVDPTVMPVSHCLVPLIQCLDRLTTPPPFLNLFFPRSFRVLAYRSLVLLRVPQHEAQMSAVHRGDGGTPY
jgi:hypothetical protein